MKEKKTKIVSRIIALFLALIMLGGVAVAAIQSFALSPTVLAIANTGDQGLQKGWIIAVAVVAIVIMVCAMVLPKLKKK